MSILSLASPAEAALPALQVVAANALNFARPLLGLGILAALLVVFKPLLIGVMRAALLVIRPRQSVEERSSREILKSVLMMHRMARDVEQTHPSLAAELRSIASRN